MFGKLIGSLLHRPGPADTIVWDCDPLVIVELSGEVAFAGKAQVEFTPTSGDRGDANALVEGGFTLDVDQRINRPVSIDMHVSPRGGFTLLGRDAGGNEMTWLIGRAADDFLRAPAL